MLDLALMGKRIRKYRRMKGFTLENLAEIVDVSTVFINDIERGIKCPRMDNFIKIANALDVTADELLCDSINADSDLLLNEISKKMHNLSAKQITSLSKIIDLMINEFYNK